MSDRILCLTHLITIVVNVCNVTLALSRHFNNLLPSRTKIYLQEFDGVIDHHQ